MTNKNKGEWSAAIKAVEKVVDILPTDEEIKANVEAIDSLVSFLQQMRTVMLEQPTRDTRQDVSNAITVLSSFLSSHNARLLLTVKTRARKSTLRSESAVGRLFDELNTLSLEDIQNKLLNPNLYSVGDLKALAKHLRIGLDKNFRREDIADSIFKRGFANPRGYKAIGGMAAQRIQEEEEKQR